MSRRNITWWVLAVLVAAFLAYLRWLRLENYFGQYHDDTVYFSSAQALAQGQGYVLPSFPGTPAQTKYPVFYPWLLSWIWRWWPSFPGNVPAAVWMTAAFGCWFLVAAYCLLRRLPGLGEWPAVACVALCAYHPFFLSLSGAVLSDMPFMALALTAVVVADHALSSKDRVAAAAAAGALAGLSTATRAIGVTVAVAIVAAALYRRAYRQAGIFCLASAPLVILVLSPHLEGRAAPTDASAPGWHQTWLYYASYWQFWKLCVPNFDVFRAMVAANLKDLLAAPASLCLFPPPGGAESFGGFLLSVTLSAGILAGILRKGRSGGWKCIHFVALFYVPVTLVWNYPIMNRFLMLFLPLLYAGLWIEGRHLVSMIQANLRPDRRASEKLVAGVLGLSLAVLASAAVKQYLRGLRPDLRAGGERRAALGSEKDEAYDWIRRHTDAGARFLASEDICLYLHTGRQAIWPIAFTTTPFYQGDTQDLKLQLDHITDVARHVGARYWVAVEGDYYIETTSPLVAERLSQLKAALPQVFDSSRHRVQLYDLSCVHQPEEAACQAAWPVLFPAGRPAAPGA